MRQGGVGLSRARKGYHGIGKAMERCGGIWRTWWAKEGCEGLRRDVMG